MCDLLLIHSSVTSRRQQSVRALPSLLSFRVTSDERLVRDFDPSESKLSNESSLLCVNCGEVGSVRSAHQISQYPLSLPLRFKLPESARAYRGK